MRNKQPVIHQVYAQYTESTVRVYQAYNAQIAEEAVRLGRFGEHFKLERMTWIKPSFLWMMYRAGWAEKEGQTHVLAIDIRRSFFDRLIDQAVLSTYHPTIHGSKENWHTLVASSTVRCQFDPDRNPWGDRLERRAIQLGIRGSMVHAYLDNIVGIQDITPEVQRLKCLRDQRQLDASMLPLEILYPVDNPAACGRLDIVG